MKTILVIFFFQSLYLNANAFNANDHRIAVLVNDQLITSYEVVQRMKLSAILSGIDITAENNNQLDIDSLYVKEAFVGKSLVMKRFRPRAKGRASPIKKPFSRITIVLSEKKEVASGSKN